MNRFLAPVFVTALLAGVWAPAQAAEPTPEHSAACVAALERKAEDLAEQFRQGNAQVESELVQRLQQGFAFIGSAYKQGVRDDEANRLLREAEKAQETLSAADLAARQSACQAEGSQLLARANLIERAFVSRAAQKRVDRLKAATS